jgi:hypothetical protein
LGDAVARKAIRIGFEIVFQRRGKGIATIENILCGGLPRKAERPGCAGGNEQRGGRNGQNKLPRSPDWMKKIFP